MPELNRPATCSRATRDGGACASGRGGVQVPSFQAFVSSKGYDMLYACPLHCDCL